MLNNNCTSIPPFSSIALIPAFPKISDMLGAHIEYVRCRPYQRLPIIETGIVIGYQLYKGELFLKVSPDTIRCPKWVSEFDFLSYVHSTVKGN